MTLIEKVKPVVENYKEQTGQSIVDYQFLRDIGQCLGYVEYPLSYFSGEIPKECKTALETYKSSCRLEYKDILILSPANMNSEFQAMALGQPAPLDDPIVFHKLKNGKCQLVCMWDADGKSCNSIGELFQYE